VHLFGLCSEMDAINEIANRHHLTVIEDAAQAIGAEYPGSNGVRQAGTIFRSQAETSYASLQQPRTVKLQFA